MEFLKKLIPTLAVSGGTAGVTGDPMTTAIAAVITAFVQFLMARAQK